MTDDSRHYITGQAPPCYTYKPAEAAPLATDTTATRKELIEQWYLEPLEKMGGHQAFVCMAICFLLYEKYLRAVLGLDENYKFSKGSKVFGVVGSDFGVSASLAYSMWSDWRNGLLHRGMPNDGGDYVWMMTSKQKEICVQKGNEVWINPWRLRDCVVGKLRQKKVWRDAKSPLMREFRIIDP